MERREVTLHNDPDRVSEVVETLLKGLSDSLEESTRYGLRLGIHEMVLNAIEHGNLEITAQEKEQAIEQASYDRLLEERQADPRYAARRVTVHVTRDDIQGLYECSIKDEGRGFDWKQWLGTRTSPDHFQGGCWRGIALAQHAAETVTYNEIGNEVTLTVRAQTATEGVTVG